MKKETSLSITISGFIVVLIFAFSHTPLAFATSSACIPPSYSIGALSNAQNSLNNTLQANIDIYQQGVSDLNTQQQQYLNTWQKQEDTAMHAGEVLSFDAVRLYYSQMLADEQATYNNSLSQLQTTKSNADLSAQNQFSRDKSTIEYNQAFAKEWCAVQSLQYCKATYGAMATANADGSCTVSCPSDYAYASSTRECNPITIPIVPPSETTAPPPIIAPTTATPTRVAPTLVQRSHAPIKLKSVPVAPIKEVIVTATPISASTSPVIVLANPPQMSFWARFFRALNPISWF